jgi:hypothetical protein
MFINKFDLNFFYFFFFFDKKEIFFFTIHIYEKPSIVNSISQELYQQYQNKKVKLILKVFVESYS